ncbi:PREDICTED: uncharacterized protein LOC109306096 [Crocodylus porosus]|uniref:uncharacterized protein LOC109306096 n=1 Tax=Crocodylus porosus TaxID=8502 RepID=UPI00093DBA5C|nr:PREDICTED: uncharacterized protein LOC109306096 [Crocodylus porosus]
MMRLVILMTIPYFIHFSVSSGSELSVIQYPQDINVSLDSTVLILCEFDYPDKTTVDTEVYWRKGPDCNRPGLKPSPSISHFQKSQVQITKETTKRFSILKLNNVQLDDSNMYFCDVTLTDPPPPQNKCGKGTKLTVHGPTCYDSRSDKNIWMWLLLLGYSISATIIIIAFLIHQCCKKSRINSRNTDGNTTLPSEWTYDKPPRTVNNGFNQEYEDMTLIRTFTHNGRMMK